MDYTQLFNTMIIFVALMVIGYGGARMKVLNADFSKAAGKLVMNVFLSASILNSVIGKQPDISGAQLWNTLFILSLSLLICYTLGALVSRTLHTGKENAPVVELLMDVPNNMFVGLPIVQELFGATGVLYMAIGCIPFNILLYTYAVWRLKTGKGDKTGHIRLKDILTVPFLITPIAIILFFLRLPVPDVVERLASILAAATMPMSMIVIGATLGGVNLLDAFREKLSWFICFIRLVLAPLLVWLILSFLTKDPVLLVTAVIIAGCPSGIVVTVFALQYDYDPVISSKGVLAATSLSMLTLPVWVAVLL